MPFCIFEGGAMLKRFKRTWAIKLLPWMSTILTYFPYTNFTSRILDKLIKASDETIL
jgi:hypothetical protein